MDWTPGVGWHCATCGCSFSNDEVKDAYAPLPQKDEPEEPFNAWLDEQRLKQSLISPGSRGAASKSKRFGNKKRLKLVPWYQSNARG